VKSIAIPARSNEIPARSNGGTRADFAALHADPLADMSNMKTIRDVYIGGNRVSR
jgi:imidazolonepropionase-like amidohydrolase